MLGKEPEEKRKVRFGEGEKRVFRLQEFQKRSSRRFWNEEIFLESVAEVKLVSGEKIIDFFEDERKYHQIPCSFSFQLLSRFFCF